MGTLLKNKNLLSLESTWVHPLCGGVHVRRLKFTCVVVFVLFVFILCYAPNDACISGRYELSFKFCLRRVWRYQRGNQNPNIEEVQTTQWPREKVQKDKQQSTKHTYKRSSKTNPTNYRWWTQVLQKRKQFLLH